jgi:DNA-binding NarL/FixJ family response regulator
MIGNHFDLTPAEPAVLRLLARGMSAKRIAAELHIKVDATERRLERFYARIGMTSFEAAIWARQIFDYCLKEPS